MWGGGDGVRVGGVSNPGGGVRRCRRKEREEKGIESVIAAHWPARIDPEQVGSDELAKVVIEAREALLSVLSLDELA